MGGDVEGKNVGGVLLMRQDDDTLHAKLVGGDLRIDGLLQHLQKLHVAWHVVGLLQLQLHDVARLKYNK